MPREERKKQRDYGPEMEGEGNKSADRHYREGAERHAKDPESSRKAREAAEALEGEEGRELDEARRESGGHEPAGRT